MKLYYITDSIDSAVGLRLSGIESSVVNDAQSAVQALEKAASDEENGIVIISDSLASACETKITELRKKSSLPLIVTLPCS